MPAAPPAREKTGRQPGDGGRRARRGRDSRAAAKPGAAESRWSPRKRPPPARRWRSPTGSSWSIRSTAPASSSPTMANSPSMSALIERGAPIAGAVYAPALERLWFGGGERLACACAVGADLPPSSAWRALEVRAAPPQLVALASRSHCDAETEAFLGRLPIGERRSARLIAEILRHRRRRGRRLSALRADDGMGHRRGRRRAARRRRRDARRRRRTATLRQARGWLAQRTASSPGATGGRRRLPDIVNRPSTARGR